jgi:hypothetical protein
MRNDSTPVSPRSASGAVAVTAQPHHTPALFPDGVIAGRWRILGVLGVGGTATVFEALDQQTGTHVALKAIPRDERMLRRARRELRVAATLDHPAIVRLLDSAEDGDYIYVAFELVRGDDLARAFHDGALDDAGVLRAVAAVLDALDHAHSRGVVHRDVKPGNVLLRDDGVLKLTDFGIALVDHPDATIDDRLLGTLSYMAPEQVLGKPVDGASDVFSAALMAFEALAGENPFRARTPRELAERHQQTELTLSTQRPDLPAVVLRHIDRALSRDPKRRPTAAKLRDALLHGAAAIERGMVTSEPAGLYDDTTDRPPLGDRLTNPLRRAAATIRRLPRPLTRRPRLVVVPDGAPDTIVAPLRLFGVDADRGAVFAERLRVMVAARGELAERVVSVVLATLAAAMLLNSLAFYPDGWAYGLAVVAGLVTILAPRIAVILIGALALPVFGNLALGLVAPVAACGVVWLVAIRRVPRYAFAPLAAPILVACGAWPVYLVACATARRGLVRFALGACGPLVTTLVCGLLGVSSPLTGVVPGAGLASRLASRESAIAVTGLVVSSAGRGLFVMAVGWGLLALAAHPLWRLAGGALRWFGAVWVSVGVVVTVFAPVVAGDPPAAVGRAAVGAVAAAIVLVVVSMLRRDEPAPQPQG